MHATCLKQQHFLKSSMRFMSREGKAGQQKSLGDIVLAV
jgi:hypothetical protein